MIEIETKQELAFALLWIAWELLASKGMRFVAELAAFSKTGQWTAYNVKIAYLQISYEEAYWQCKYICKAPLDLPTGL